MHGGRAAMPSDTGASGSLPMDVDGLEHTQCNPPS
jgi:hypothetical protein